MAELAWTRRVHHILRCLLLLLPSLAWSASEVHPIQLARGDAFGQRNVPVALLLTVQIAGRNCSVQLDTGMNAAFAWQADAHARSPETVRVALGSLARDVSISPKAREALASCSLGSPIASLGNAFFDQGSIDIDMAAGRMAVFSTSVLEGNADAKPFRYARWGDVGGHILVRTASLGTLPSEAMLDTGAFPIDLGVHDSEVWQALVGEGPRTVKTFSIPAWGKSLRCLQSKATVSIGVFGTKEAPPSILYCPNQEFVPGEPILGILGMQRFQHGRIVIDYPARKWLATPSAAEPTH